MALTVSHTFVSPATDLGEAGKLGPSEWNANHGISGSLTAAEVGADPAGSAAAAQAALRQVSAYLHGGL